MTRFAPRALPAILLAAVAVPLLLGPKPVLALPSVEDYGLNSLSGTYLAARVADVGKDMPSAAAFYSTALRADPENLFLLERSMLLTAAAGEIETALGFARQLLERTPGNAAARLILAVDDVQHLRYRKAIESLATPGAGVLADLTGALLVAWARFGEGEVDRAIKDLDTLKGEEWYEPFKQLHTGYIALASGRTEEAIAALDKAKVADPNAVRVTEAYARALVVAGRVPEAEAAMQDFISRFPDNALARATLDDIRAGRGREMTVGTPGRGCRGSAGGHRRGRRTGRRRRSRLPLPAPVTLSRSDNGRRAGGSLALGTCSTRAARARRRSRLSSPSRRMRPSGRWACSGRRWRSIAWTAPKKRNAPSRKPSAGTRTTCRPTYPTGTCCAGANVSPRRRTSTPKPSNGSGPGRADWSLFYFRGIAYERTKDWDKAEADFRKALEFFPDQPLVLNYLGYSMVDNGRNLEEALGMIRKAVELRPTDGYIVDSLGWAYYKLGRFEEAVTELERAVSLRPEDPVIHDHLGDAYWKTGRLLEAQFQWRHARDFGAKSPELELILRKIAEGRLIEGNKDASLEGYRPVRPAAHAHAPEASCLMESSGSRRRRSTLRSTSSAGARTATMTSTRWQSSRIAATAFRFPRAMG
jgi:Flp pilus assembly protein TadD